VSVAENGAELSRELISTDFYLPVPEIILRFSPTQSDKRCDPGHTDEDPNDRRA